jgi:hypothetical protein
MQPVGPQPSLEEPAAPIRTSWHQKLATFLFIMVCFEVGLFLTFFPWMEYWDHNSLAAISPMIRALWDSAYFRGALSGLGLVNIYISMAEISRLRKSRTDRLKVSLL